MSQVTLYPVIDGNLISDHVSVPVDHWNTLVSGNGTTATSINTYDYVVLAQTTTKYVRLYRGCFRFDTSVLGARATIQSATLSLYGTDKTNNSPASPNINIYSQTIQSPGSLVADDFQNVGSTALSTTISYASFNTAGYNDFALNASGLAAISKTGITSFCTRCPTYDVANVDPGFDVNQTYSFTVAMSDNVDSVPKPRLVINYIKGATADAIGQFPTYHIPNLTGG